MPCFFAFCTIPPCFLLLLLLHLHAAGWSALPTDVQLDAKGQEGERKRKEGRGNETCVFSLTTDFLSCSSLEIIRESGSQKTASLTNQNVPPDIQALQ